MIKQNTQLQIKKGERLYQFLLDHDAPLGEIHDALTEMKLMVIQKIVDSEKPKTEPGNDCV